MARKFTRCVFLAVVLVGSTPLFLGCSSSDATTNPGLGLGATETADESRAVVARRDFTIALQLDGITEASNVIPLAPHTGISVRIDQRNGPVQIGDVLGKREINRALTASQGPPASVSSSQVALLKAQTGTLLSPASGLLRGSNLVAPGVDVVAQLTPLQALRFRSAKFEGRATVETVLGQRQVSCAALWLGPTEDAGTESASTTLRCRLPQYAETVPGLRATLAIKSETLKNAIVVPNLALEYDIESDGYAVNILVDGESKSVPVQAGPTDGVARVITTRLPVGAELVLPDAGIANPDDAVPAS